MDLPLGPEQIAVKKVKPFIHVFPIRPEGNNTVEYYINIPLPYDIATACTVLDLAEEPRESL